MGARAVWEGTGKGKTSRSRTTDDPLRRVFRRASLSDAGDRDNLLAHPEYLILGPEGLAEGRTHVDPGWRRRRIATALGGRIVEVLRARTVGGK
jgi:hypothetical protein